MSGHRRKQDERRQRVDPVTWQGIFASPLRTDADFEALLGFLSVLEGEPMSAEDVLQIRCESNARFWERRRDRHFRLWPGCDDGPSNDAEWNYFREGMNVWGEHLTEVVRIYERRMYMVYPDRANRPGWLTPGSGLLKARLFVAADAYIRPLHDPDWIVAMTHEWLQVGTLLVREGESDHKA